MTFFNCKKIYLNWIYPETQVQLCKYFCHQSWMFSAMYNGLFCFVFFQASFIWRWVTQPFTNFASTALPEERQQMKVNCLYLPSGSEIFLYTAKVLITKADQKLPYVTKEALILSRSEWSCQKIFPLQPRFIIWWHVVHDKSEPVEPGSSRSFSSN